MAGSTGHSSRPYSSLEQGQFIAHHGASLNMEPRRIASYTLLEPIGHGGMSVVYRAHHEALDRTVAVKILSENRLTQS